MRTLTLLKFIYSEKATKFCEISTADLTVTKGVFFSESEILFPNLPISGFGDLKNESHFLKKRHLYIARDKNVV